MEPKFRAVSRDDEAKTVAARWKEARYDPKIGRQLAAIAVPTADEVDILVGNDSWTRLECIGCHRAAVAVVRFREEDEFDRPAIQLCESCARAICATFDLYRAS